MGCGGYGRAHGGLTKGIGFTSAFSDLGIGGTTFGDEFAQGALTNAFIQGIGVATGLQKKFNWAGVAEAGIAAGVGGALAGNDFVQNINIDVGGPYQSALLTNSARGLVSGMAGDIAAPPRAR